MIFFPRFIGRRFGSSFIDLGTRIKQLNDTKEFQKAIDLFNSNHHQSNFSALTINQALKACIELSDFNRAINLHQHLSSKLLNNYFIRNSLIRLYMKSGDIIKAQEIFDQSAVKTNPMYNSMLSGFLDHNRAQDAFDLFQKMNIPPNKYILPLIFKICTQLGTNQSLERGEEIFKTMPIQFKNDTIVLTAALQMFIKSGDMNTAEQMFSQMNKNLVTYAVMMAGFISNKMSQRAMDLFPEISNPNQTIFKLYFNACTQLGNKEALKAGKRILSQLPNHYHQDTDLLNSVLIMFIKCDDVESAQSLFTRLPRNITSYRLMMKMYIMKSEPEKTLDLFEQMKREKIEPNDIIYTLLIDACSHIGDLSLCQWLVSQMSPSLFTDRWIQNGLVDMWGKVAAIEESKRIFETIVQPNDVSFSAMINAYGLNGMGKEAIQLFRRVPLDMMDEWIYVCVLNACSHSGFIQDAREIFDKIPIQFRTEKIYTTMVDGLCRLFHFDEAQRLIDEFEKDHSPYIPMYTAMLSGARINKNKCLSQKIFDRMNLLFPDVESCLLPATVLLSNTYSSVGDFSKALQVRLGVDRMSLKKKVGLTWTVVNGKVVRFRAHDQSNARSAEIYAELNQLTKELIQHGHKFDSAWITRPLDNDETTESVLCGHSERLAIAFNLIQRPVPTRIQVVKNLRICGDCHGAIKLIAQIRHCLIVVRDANRIHHFHPDGTCSCGDHF